MGELLRFDFDGEDAALNGRMNQLSEVMEERFSCCWRVAPHRLHPDVALICDFPILVTLCDEGYDLVLPFRQLPGRILPEVIPFSELAGFFNSEKPPIGL